jgi:hypothetical protein
VADGGRVEGSFCGCEEIAGLGRSSLPIADGDVGKRGENDSTARYPDPRMIKRIKGDIDDALRRHDPRVMLAQALAKSRWGCWVGAEVPLPWNFFKPIIVNLHTKPKTDVIGGLWPV